jgi:prefoldin subunit 5
MIALDILADEVHAIYRVYLELNGMYDVLQIYDQIRYSGKYSLPSFLRLHRIVNDLGMGEQQIINVLDLANHNQLEYLQGKVEYLRTEINNLELKKTECTNHVLTLNRRVDVLTETGSIYESALSEKREEIAFLNQEQRRLDNLIDTNNDNKNNESPDTEILCLRQLAQSNSLNEIS